MDWTTLFEVARRFKSQLDNTVLLFMLLVLVKNEPLSLIEFLDRRQFQNSARQDLESSETLVESHLDFQVRVVFDPGAKLNK